MNRPCSKLNNKKQWIGPLSQTGNSCPIAANTSVGEKRTVALIMQQRSKIPAAGVTTTVGKG